MSYEGYSQNLCTSGHLLEVDCYDDVPEKCEYCDCAFVFSHDVDNTNGENNKMQFKILQDATYEECDEKYYLVDPAIYEIPNKI
jgi:hypothetical protein